MSRVAAFFDMDRTLLAVNSGTLWLRHLRAHGEIGLGQTLHALVWLVGYHLSLVDMDAVTAQAALTVKGQSEENLRARCDEWFRRDVVPYITAAGRAAVEHHRREGHVLALLSGSSPYGAGPLARLLDVPYVLSNRLEVVDGVFTGVMIRPMCWGPGKVTRAEELARAEDVDLEASWFYTDSYSDLAMLERVGHPVVVNPDPRLRRLARRRGWPIQRWR